MSALHSLDKSIVTAWNGFLVAHGALDTLVSWIAKGGVYLIPAIWVVWWFVASKRTRQNLLSSLLAGAVAWQVVNRLLKLVYYHDRPTQTLPIKEFIFHRPENSFPSDHAAFLGAIAFFFLFRKDKRIGWLLLGLAVIVSAARIAVGVHYPSDIFVGFLSGFVVAWIVNFFHDTLSQSVWEPLIALARKLHLA